MAMGNFVDYESRVAVMIEKLDSLEELYRIAFDDSSDIKALVGVERCLELRMKILGLDGKQGVGVTMAPPENLLTIDLEKLSQATLVELNGFIADAVRA